MDYLRNNNGSDHGMMSYEDFLGQLAYSMIFNELDDKINLTRGKKRKNDEEMQSLIAPVSSFIPFLFQNCLISIDCCLGCAGPGNTSAGSFARFTLLSTTTSGSKAGKVFQW